MILGALTDKESYLSISPRLKQAFEYLKSVDLATLGEGRYEIDGEHLFMTLVKNKEMKQKGEAKLEVHDRYIDIQIPISGNEIFGWSNRKSCKIQIREFDLQRDILFFEDVPSNYITVKPGEFMVFFPEDAHAPMVGKGTITKCIIKVEI